MGGQVRELFEPVEASLDHIALLVGVGVESWAAATWALCGELVGTFGTDEPDPPMAQYLPRRRCEYALSATTTAGRTRGRPGSVQAALMPLSSGNS
ncbi:hypothetical protein [Nocardia brevicatena]|uniref:hypothetical protein n=1 Tax=Nocardia brevicatena TaxID=37327 RepID=UPI000592720B|nr:hypothetical protein [Nocardia brevicatena]